MPVIVPPGQFNPASLSADDLYISILNPPGYIQGVATDVFGTVGTASWGPVNIPVHMGSPFDALSNWGPVGPAALTDQYDMATDLAIAFGQSASQASLEGWGVRVTDGTDTAASAAVAGAATSAASVATLAGSITNGDTGTLIFTSSALAGSPISVVANVVTADTLTTIAEKFVLAINANVVLAAAGIYATSLAAVISIYQPTTLSPQMTLTRTAGSTLTITISTGTASTTGMTLAAIYTGTLGNTLIYTIVPGSALNTFTFIVSLPAIGAQEFYPNLPSVGFFAAAANAINRGLSNVRGPSLICKASGGNPAVGTPGLIGQTLLAGGTDGRAGVVTATLVGNSASLPQTGMYALSQVNPQIGIFWLVGCTDNTVVPLEVAFAQTSGCTALFPFPPGTSTAAALAFVQNNGYHDPAFAYVKDWIYWFDVLNNQVRLVSPLAFIGGRIGTLSPCINPGNEPVNLVEGTERFPPNAAGPIPYTVSEVGQLENAGVMFITNPIPAGSQWGIRHGKTTSLQPATAGVEWWRMSIFLARSFARTMGQFVDQNQSQKPNDPLRNAVKNQLNTFLTFLASPAAGVGDGNGLIDSFTVVCAFSNSSSAVAGNGVNTPQSIAQHYLFVLVKVTYLSAVNFFVLALQGGTTVVTVGATQGQALAA